MYEFGGVWSRSLAKPLTRQSGLADSVESERAPVIAIEVERREVPSPVRKHELQRFEPPNRCRTVLVHIVAFHNLLRGGSPGDQREVVAIGAGVGGGVGEDHRSEIFEPFA